MSIKEYRMRKLEPEEYEKLVRKQYEKIKDLDEKDILFSELRTDLLLIAVGCIHMVETYMGSLWDHPGSFAPPAKGYHDRFQSMRNEIFDRVNVIIDKWNDKLVSNKEPIKGKIKQ